MTNNPPKLIDMMSQLIAIPSISCTQPQLDQSNKPVINLLANWAESAGFKCDIQQIAHSNKYNLIASIGSGNDGLMLSGHTDTVPYDEAQWQSDPFKLTHKNERFYGLGSCDMKSFIAMTIETTKDINLKKLKRPLVLCATANEESDMSGARWLKNNFKHSIKNCIIGEPTNLKPIHQHKGILMESIVFHGQAGHSSDPSNGNSALEGMLDFMNAIKNYRQELQNNHINPAFEVPIPTLNFGHIHGGDNPNRICAKCQLDIDLRFLPGMSLELLRESIQHIAHQVAENRGLNVSFDMLFQGLPALDTPINCQLTQYLEEQSQSKSATVAFATEGPIFNQIGMNSIILGPGSINQAHQANEYIAENQINPCLKLLKNSINRFCI